MRYHTRSMVIHKPRAFLIQDSGWFYLGVHRFSYAAMESVWHKLSKEVCTVHHF